MMACLELDSSQFLSNSHAFDSPFDLQLECNISDEVFSDSASCISSQSPSSNVPNAPLLPVAIHGRKRVSGTVKKYSCLPQEVWTSWDKLFQEGFEADVHVLTDDGAITPAHLCILGISSSVLRNMLEQATYKEGFRRIRISGVPSEAARIFLRFLYSSCYEQDKMKECAFQLLVLAHVYAIPSLKRVCISEIEQALLTAENVVDILQLARQCDAPRLSMMCTRKIIQDFKTVSLSEGWKVMRQADPSMEQELLESLVEADSKKLERTKKKEEKKVYVQLYEAMEALLHICRDGCRTIGPRDKMLKDSQDACNFLQCRGVELLVRHFSSCKMRVPGGCGNCKRMWQLLELHSRMCGEPDSCKVPLCRHFKEKMLHLSKKEEMKWKLLVCKVLASRGTISSICARRHLAS